MVCALLTLNWLIYLHKLSDSVNSFNSVFFVMWFKKNGQEVTSEITLSMTCQWCSNHHWKKWCRSNQVGYLRRGLKEFLRTDAKYFNHKIKINSGGLGQTDSPPSSYCSFSSMFNYLGDSPWITHHACQVIQRLSWNIWVGGWSPWRTSDYDKGKTSKSSDDTKDTYPVCLDKISFNDV